jgi:tyrosyl-tRNA synthetase
MTQLVHGSDGLQRAERATGVLFGTRAVRELPAAELLDVFADVPSTTIPRARLAGEGTPLPELLVDTRLASSKGEARRLVTGGGVYLNGERLEAVERRVVLEDAIEGEVLVLRRGRKDHHVVRVAG